MNRIRRVMETKETDIACRNMDGWEKGMQRKRETSGKSGRVGGDKYKRHRQHDWEKEGDKLARHTEDQW